MNKKFMKTIFPVVLSSIVLSACSFQGKGTDYNATYNVPGANKTEINFKNFGGGIGRLWIDQAADRFAEKMLNHSFADGKKGVYIKIDHGFNEGASTMDQGGADIYFDERESDITAFAQRGLLLNLDEIYDDTTRVGGTLRSKIFPDAVGSVSATIGGETHFYGLPHYEYYGGLSLNYKMFEQYNAFFVDMSTEDPDDINEIETKFGTAYLTYDSRAPKSVGPDGIKGTNDDGLPRTLDEFLMLCDYFSKKCGSKMAAVTISGKHATNYADYFVGGLWSNLAGTEQMRNYYDCEGTIEIVKRNSRGELLFTEEPLFPGINYIHKPQTELYTFKGDGTDGYKGNDMVAKFYAMATLDILKTEGYFNADSKTGGDHYYAQKNLIYGDVANNPFNQNAAMLIDGTYWYNEANEHGSLKEYEERSGEPMNSLDCRMMSLPVDYYMSDSFVGREQCLLDMGQAYAMINANVKNNQEKKDACIELMKFLYSEDELQRFTLLTGMPRMIDCGLTEAQKANAGSFYKNMFDLRAEDGSNLVSLGSEKPYWKNIRDAVRICLGKGSFLIGSRTMWLQFEAGKHTEEAFEYFSYNENTWPKW